jgi:hypothetical protein
MNNYYPLRICPQFRYRLTEHAFVILTNSGACAVVPHLSDGTKWLMPWLCHTNDDSVVKEFKWSEIISVRS